MRGGFKLLILLLLAAFVVPFFWGPGGKPLLHWTPPKNLSTPPLPDLSKAKELLGQEPSPTQGKEGAEEKKRIYKYRDSSGKLVFSDVKPSEGVSYSTVDTSIPANVIPTQRLPETAKASGTSKTNNPENSSPYSPEGVKKVTEDAKNVEKLLNDRKKAMDKALDGG